MRALNGQLFDIDAAGAIFSDESPVEKPDFSQHIGPSPSQAGANPLNDEDWRSLEIMKNKVGQFWIKGVLEQSVRHSAMMELGLDNMPEMVDSPWGSMPIPAEQSIGATFNEVGRSLLLLGEPGAGKTTIMLRLAKELLNQYEITSGLPLPVIFNLSSFTHAKKTFVQWLADEMSMKYMIPRKIGEQWLQNHRLLLLLDGLDEVGMDRREECVKAINEFLQETAVPGLVVCCRFKEYIHLNNTTLLRFLFR